MSRLPLFPWTAALVWTARHWSTESQVRSRRNALAANTVLAARRAEREDVAAFLATAGSADVAVPEQRRGLG